MRPSLTTNYIDNVKVLPLLSRAQFQIFNKPCNDFRNDVCLGFKVENSEIWSRPQPFAMRYSPFHPRPFYSLRHLMYVLERTACCLMTGRYQNTEQKHSNWVLTTPAAALATTVAWRPCSWLLATEVPSLYIIMASKPEIRNRNESSRTSDYSDVGNRMFCHNQSLLNTGNENRGSSEWACRPVGMEGDPLIMHLERLV